MQTPRRLLPLLALLLLSAGCYTLLEHPGGTQHAAPAAGGHAVLRDCRDCHDQAYLYHYGYNYRRPYSWRSYYSRWWYDDYWYYDPYWIPDWNDGGGTGAPLPAGEWDESRRRKRGDAVRFAPGVRVPAEAPPASPGGQVQEDRPGNAPPAKPDEKPKDKPKEKKKPRRKRR